MLQSKHIDKICIVAAALALAICVALFAWAQVSGATENGTGSASGGTQVGYEDKLFNTDSVHSIDIQIDDWDDFIANATSEEYSACDVVIDGETFSAVGIRGKGNTSLSKVKDYGNDRYSFKIEFDHYTDASLYHGLDKLSLNNIIQDKTYMKDYLSYQLMNANGVNAPLCSYAWITVNGEDWGLYLAVEGVEDGFMERCYGGAGEGDLYKPDSMDMGGGRGNGKDFDGDIDFSQLSGIAQGQGAPTHGEGGAMPGGGGGTMPGGTVPEMPEGFGGFGGNLPDNFDGNTSDGFSGFNGNMPDMSDMPDGFDGTMPDGSGGTMPDMSEGFGGPNIFGGAGGFGGGMNSQDVRLQYIDDSVSSYANIFDSAKTTPTAGAQSRLIESLKTLSGVVENGGDVSSAVDIDQVMRYFVVHNYVCNSDSYTGQMVHNYYLYEAEDGRLSMIPWDYNLAFGGFANPSASATVNDAIDTPLSVSGDGSRPMFEWITSSDEYTQLYHRYCLEFLQNVDIAGLIERTNALIAPYVEKDPTAFFTYDEYTAAVSMLEDFCTLRTQSVLGQLSGIIPSTDAGQSEDSSTLINASGIDLSVMGEDNMGGGGGGGRGGGPDGDAPSGGAPGGGPGGDAPNGGGPGGGDPRGGGGPDGPGGPGGRPDANFNGAGEGSGSSGQSAP